MKKATGAQTLQADDCFMQIKKKTPCLDYGVCNISNMDNPNFPKPFTRPPFAVVCISPTKI